MIKKYLPHILLAIYLILFVYLGINPYARDVWYVENGPIFGIVLLLVIGWFKGIRLSNTSYILMSVLIYMHTIGGHYTFEKVPFDWFNNFFGFERNMYDRVAHFTVGFYAFPFAEYLSSRKLVNKKWIAYTLPLFFIISLAAVYEMFEWWFADTYGGEAGAAFLGSQGDIWDAQKDMLMDTLGAITSLVLFGVYQCYEKNKVNLKKYTAAILISFIIIFFLFFTSIKNTNGTKTNNHPVLVTQSVKMHTNINCGKDSSKEYILSEKENYQLVVLCAGYVIPTDKTTAIDVDQVFLKDIKTGRYYGAISYESTVMSNYTIIAINYPRIFIRSCYEGCSAPIMIELNNGPNDPFHYFDIKNVFYRNNVSVWLGVVNNKVIVAGERKIAEFDPITFNIKTLYEAKGNQSIGFSNAFPIFESSVKKLGSTHLEFKVYSDENRYIKVSDMGEEYLPKEDYKKIIEIQ